MGGWVLKVLVFILFHPKNFQRLNEIPCRQSVNPGFAKGYPVGGGEGCCWSFNTSFGICFVLVFGVEIPFNSLWCFAELKSSFQGPGTGFEVSQGHMQLSVPWATAWPWGWCAAKYFLCL